MPSVVCQSYLPPPPGEQLGSTPPPGPVAQKTFSTAGAVCSPSQRISPSWPPVSKSSSSSGIVLLQEAVLAEKGEAARQDLFRLRHIEFLVVGAVDQPPEF